MQMADVRHVRSVIEEEGTDGRRFGEAEGVEVEEIAMREGVRAVWHKLQGCRIRKIDVLNLDQLEEALYLREMTAVVQRKASEV